MSEICVTVALVDHMTFIGTDERGLQVTMDAATEVDGRDQGPTPMELLAMALGGCTGMDVISMLRKMRQDVSAYEVHVSGPRSADHPQIFSALSVEHVVHGKNLDPDRVRHAIELSATRYCSVSAMLSRAATVTHSCRVLARDGTQLAGGPLIERSAA